MVTKIKPYQSKNNLMKLNQCMKDFINNLQKSGTWEIQLTIVINNKLSKKMKVSKTFWITA